MTRFEYHQEDSAQEPGESAHELFARTIARTQPQLGFTADDLVLDGRRRVRRRRVAAMVGSTASVAAIAVAATAFAGTGGRPENTLTSAATSTHTTRTPHTTPTTTPPTSPTTSKPPADADRAAADKRLATAVFAQMLGELDPGGKHLTLMQTRNGDSPYTPNGAICIEKAKLQIADGLTAYWTADGKSPFPRGQTDTSPWSEVSVMVTAPDQGADQFGGTKDWGPITTTHLPDGSVLRTASGANGHRMQAVRTTTNHQQIVLSVIDSWVNGGDAQEAQSLPTNPFPFTITQLASIVSRMSLPLPFADGYLIHTQCGP